MTNTNGKEAISIGEAIRLVYFNSPIKRLYFKALIPFIYVIALVFSFIYLSFWMALLAGVVGVFLLIHLPSILITANVYGKRMDALKAHEEHVARMEAIRKSMTPAEWEMYKIQLENQRLLKNIRSNQNRPTYGVGFVREIDN